MGEGGEDRVDQSHEQERKCDDDSCEKSPFTMFGVGGVESCDCGGSDKQDIGEDHETCSSFVESAGLVMPGVDIVTCCILSSILALS